MPPIQLKIICLECNYSTQGYMMRVLKRGDKHAEERGHELAAIRKSDGSRFCIIHPPNTIEMDFRK